MYRFLGLNVAGNLVLAVPHPEIRIAGLGLLRESGYVNLASAAGCGELLKERFETGVKALFPCVPLDSDIGDCFEVVLQYRFSCHRASIWETLAYRYRQKRSWEVIQGLAVCAVLSEVGRYFTFYTHPFCDEHDK
jgi:hypothetical protein